MAIQLVINVNSQGAVTEINQITGAFDKLGNELKQTNTQIYNTGKAVNTIEKDAGKAGGAFSKFQANVIAINSAVMLVKQGFDFVSGALGGFIQVSSDATETQSKFNNTFLESAGIANQVASDIASSYQRSNIAVQEGIATFGAFLKPLGMAGEKGLEMAAALEKLTLDLASFNNTTDEEMFQKLMSGMAGETEAVRRLGIDISEVAIKHELFAMGVKKASDQVTQAEKVQARFNLIMKQTSLQQGDVARTSESWANQTKEAAAAFEEFQKSAGDALINALLPYVKELSAWFKENKEDILAFGKSAAETIGSLISGIAEVIKVVWSMRDIIVLAGEAYLTYWSITKIKLSTDAIISGFTAASASVSTFATSMSTQITGISSALSYIGPAVVTAFATYAITDFILEVTGAKQAMFEFFSELEAEEIAEAQRQADLKNGLSGMAWQRSAVNEKIRETAKLLGEESSSLLESAKAVYKNKEEFSKLSPEIQRTIEKMAGVQVGIEKYIVESEKKEKADKASKEWTDLLAKSYESLSGSIGILTSDSMKNLNAQMVSSQSVWAKNSKLILDNEKMTENFSKSIESMIETLRANGKEVPGWLHEISKALKDELIKYAGLATVPTSELNDIFEKSIDIIREQSDLIFSKQVPAFLKESDATEKAKEKQQKLNDETIRSRKAFSDMIPAITQIVDGFKEWGIMSEKSAGKLKALTGSFSILYDKETELIELQNKMNQGENVSFGEIFSAGIGAAIGTFSTFYSLIETFFGRNWENEAKSRLSGLYGVTGDMVSQLAKLAEETGSADEAFKKLFATMLESADIRDAMGFDTWAGSFQEMVDQILGSIQQVQDAIGGRNTGDQLPGEEPGVAIGTTQVTEDLEKGFEALRKKAEELGLTGTKAFLDIIRAGDELLAQGQKIGTIWDYQNEQIKKSTDAFSTYLGTFADQDKLKENLQAVKDEYFRTSKEIADEIASLQEQLLDEGLSDKQRKKIQDEIDELAIKFNGLSGKYNESIGVAQAALNAAMMDVSKNWDFINVTTASQVAALQSQGISTFDIYSQYMKENLSQIAAMAKESGLEVSQEIADMIALSDFVTANENLVNRIDATRLSMEGLANANKLTENQFKAFSQQSIDQFNALVAGGATQAQAYAILGSNLQDIIAMSKAYGFTIDDATQALIDQGLVSGDLALQQKTAQQTQIEGFGLVTDAVLFLAETLGGTVPDSIKKAREALGSLTVAVEDGSDEAAAAIEDGGAAAAAAVQKSVEESEKEQKRSFLAQKQNAEKAAMNLSSAFSQSQSTVTGGIQKIGDSYAVMVDSMLTNTDRWVVGLGGVINSLDAINGKIVTLPDMKLSPGFRDELPGFATGGQFRVPGYGAVDTSLVAFRATPGEIVTVQTPSQQKQSQLSSNQVNNTKNTTITIPVTVSEFSDYQISEKISRIIQRRIGPLRSTIENV